jgi:prenylated cyclic peptide (anacyclamide/piricyclamide family)
LEINAMLKKNLRPLLAAPVSREINTTSSVNSKGIVPQVEGWDDVDWASYGLDPFAGDDAE